MQRGLVSLVAVVLTLAPLGAMGADWPNFLGPNKNGISPETGINKNWAQKPPRQLWKVPLGDDGYAGPSVADGKVLIIDHKGHDDIVRALALATGTEIWSYTYRDTDQANYGFARSTPTVDGDKVYTLSRYGIVNCLNLKDGKLVWTKDTVKEFGGKIPRWEFAMSPLIDGEKVIVCPGGRDASVVALNKATGEVIWKGGGSDAPGYATPVAATIDGKRIYVVFTATNLSGVDAETGKLLWNYGWKTEYDVNAATPIVAGHGIFITSSYNRGCAVFRITDGKITRVWENKAVCSHFSTPVMHEGHIYSTSDPGKLVCLDPKTGEVKWERRGFEKGGLVAVDGTIIVLDGRTGEVAMCELKPTEYKELGRMQGLGGQSWTAPIVADGKLIIRNKKAIACYDLK